MTGRNPWAVLCVAEDAPYHEVQRAFRRRVKLTHPDGGGDAGEFAAVIVAFDAVRRSRPGPRRQTPCRPAAGPRATGRSTPVRPTPYDQWLRPAGPGGSWIDGGHATAVIGPEGGGTGTTPAAARAGDFARVLHEEMAAAGADGG